MRVFATILFAAIISNTADAFTPVSTTTTPTNRAPIRKTIIRTPSRNTDSVYLAAEKDDENSADGPKDGTFVSSVFKKEIAYDEKTGRFFETGFGEGDCVPEEEYCIMDQDSGELIRLTTEEKERIFLDALQAYYVSGRQMLTDTEFDLLKEDLSWTGSSVVAMTKQEVKYMTAMQEYQKGNPILSDEEFDTLKRSLMEEGSKFAVQTDPKCYIDSGICKVTLQEDKFRSNLLYLPAGSILMLAWLFFGFELIEPIIRLNPIVLAVLGTPWVYTGAKSLTENLIFENKKIAYGPCPSCNFQNRVYFGNILGVEGFGDVAEVKCPNCKTSFNVQKNSLRASTLPK